MRIPELIPNDQLLLSDVPDETADWASLSRFALTFNGYADPSHGKLFTETRVAFKTGSAQLDTLTLNELRACLFHEQRHHKWMDAPGYEPNLGFMRALVSVIRADLNRTLGT